MTFYGVWSDAAGGFIDSANWTIEDAEGMRQVFIEQGEDPQDLQIKKECPDHLGEDQIAGSCEICDAEDEE